MNKRPRRNLFEIDNARTLTRDEIVATYVPTQPFWRLLSAKNHIVLGSRGSGKTVLAKMLSHSHLSKLKEKRAQDIIKAKSFIGIYVPTSIDWVGGLKNKPWQTPQEAEEFFQWRLNITTCIAFLVTLRSCLETYIQDKAERVLAEEHIVRDIGTSWLGSQHECLTTSQLEDQLEDIEFKKQQQLIRIRQGSFVSTEIPVGTVFDMSLFSPLKRAITHTARVLDFPEDTIWLLCLDEAEFLEPFQQIILNSYMRSASGNLVFKVTTMPYFHHTLETNTRVPLNVGHDFEYVYIDKDPILWLSTERAEKGQQFANTLFNKRAKVSGLKFKGVTLLNSLGRSALLERKPDNWSVDSENMNLLRKHGSEETVGRAERLLKQSQSEFMDQIGRKVQSALMLREAVASQKGRSELDVYSGDMMAIRCGDANPRRLVSIFNRFMLEATKKPGNSRYRGVNPLSAKVQTRILTAFSAISLSRVQGERDCGPELYNLLNTIGNFMKNSLHDRPLTTDYISSIKIDAKISEQQWELVKLAVGLGLLFPNVSANTPDQMPEREGTFHFAYVLAPHFRLLPRKGASRLLTTILKPSRLNPRPYVEKQSPLFENEDLP